MGNIGYSGNVKGKKSFKRLRKAQFLNCFDDISFDFDFILKKFYNYELFFHYFLLKQGVVKAHLVNYTSFK